MLDRIGSKGVSLVEVMIALVIMLIVFIGLMQAAVLSIDHNLRNEIRDAAVRAASDDLTHARALPFSSLTNTTNNVTATFRNFPVTYTVTRTITAPATDVAQIQVVVNYTYKGDALTYTLISLERNK